MTTNAPLTTRSKSPMSGGLRGPTPPCPHAHANATRLKSPQHWGDGGGPPLAHTTVVSTQEKAVLGKERKKVKMQKQTYFSPATTRTS